MNVYWLEQTDADIRAEDDWVSAGESTLLAGMRFAKRRADWRLGRWTAKRALAIYLDVPDHPRSLAEIEIHPGDSGAPEAFFANRAAQVTVSLSHRSGTAICAVAPCGAALGCDLEMIEPRADNFVADYFTAEEQSLVSRALETDRPRIVTLIWSAKESALKALRVGLQQDTRNVTVGLEGTQELCNGVSSKGRVVAGLHTWQPLQVRHIDGRVFPGWWQDTKFVRTMVSAPPSSPPIQLSILVKRPELSVSRRH